MTESGNASLSHIDSQQLLLFFSRQHYRVLFSLLFSFHEFIPGIVLSLW